jgi:hypothetical protein
MEFDIDRITQIALALMARATVVILGPGAPSLLSHHAMDRAMTRLRLRRQR